MARVHHTLGCGWGGGARQRLHQMREWEGVSFNPVSTWSLSRLCCWLAPTLCKLPATHNMRGFRGSRAQLLQYGLEMHSAQHRTHGTLHHWEHLGMLGYATGLSTIPEGGICWMEGSGGLQPHTRQTATQAGREEKPRPAERPAGPRRAFTTAQGLDWAGGEAGAAAPACSSVHILCSDESPRSKNL